MQDLNFQTKIFFSSTVLLTFATDGYWVSGIQFVNLFVKLPQPEE